MRRVRTLAWVVQRVLERPAVVTKLRAEVQEVTGGGPLQSGHQQLRYTGRSSARRCMDTLLPLVVRVLQRDGMTFAGYDLPAGTLVGPSPLLVHENPRLARTARVPS